ncbi:Uncharacterised protein [Mycobacteroides abscessus]|nr:Uncharacterised protein [Mycobacteroides abscessus]SLD25332.1 Uncharacterised protein [Mycobacteroides abscessus subsp. massiliense]
MGGIGTQCGQQPVVILVLDRAELVIAFQHQVIEIVTGAVLELPAHDRAGSIDRRVLRQEAAGVVVCGAFHLWHKQIACAGE